MAHFVSSRLDAGGRWAVGVADFKGGGRPRSGRQLGLAFEAFKRPKRLRLCSIDQILTTRLISKPVSAHVDGLKSGR